jgi:IS30 family transposase
LEDEYWKLIAEGVGTVMACKQLGIGRKTGYRWRAETGGLAPQRDSEQMHSSRYLSLLDRQRIASLRARGLGVRQIGVLVGRSASTVSRELRRGTAEHDRGGYDGDLAHARAQQRRSKPWQRGSNENTNGLLRQYFPKGTDLRIHSAATLQDVAQRLNNRPRKTLGWRTPADVFQAGVASHR